MARTRKPLTERLATGAGKRSVKRGKTLKAAVGGFLPPAWLEEIGGTDAVEIWGRRVPELVRLNLITPADADVFSRYCIHFVEWIQASRDIKEKGMTLFNQMDRSEGLMPRLNPSFRARQINEATLIDIEDRFGGSPLARLRAAAQQAALGGSFGDLFSRAREGDSDAAAPSAPGSSIGVLQPRPTVN